MDKKNEKYPGKVHIGMGGWEIPSFNGVFYPPKPGKGFRKLEYYSRYFDLVEVNATFYNTSLSPSQAQQWLKDVEKNQGFIFTVKLFRGFTHTFNATKSDALAVHKFLDPLRKANKLAGLVIQFSSSFNISDSKLEYLKKLRSAFPEDPLFLDLRHISWNTEPVCNYCREHGFHLINVDLPPLPEHMPFNLSALDNTAYFRMMGRNMETWNGPGHKDRYHYQYNEEELNDLLRRIKEAGAGHTYVVFHNDRQPFSLVNGRQLEHLIRPDKRFLMPVKLLKTFPQIKSFCDADEPNNDLFPGESNSSGH